MPERRRDPYPHFWTDQLGGGGGDRGSMMPGLALQKPCKLHNDCYHIQRNPFSFLFLMKKTKKKRRELNLCGAWATVLGDKFDDGFPSRPLVQQHSAGPHHQGSGNGFSELGCTWNSKANTITSIKSQVDHQYSYSVCVVSGT